MTWHRTVNQLMLFGGLCAIGSISFAYDEQQSKNNLAYDYATCSAYFGILSEIKDFPSDTRKRYHDLSGQEFDASARLTNPKAAAARVESEIKQMLAQLDNKPENLSILLNDYASFCKKLVEDPTSRIKYWIEKK